MRTIGMRVGAVSHTSEDTIYIFGFGVYEGDHVPPKDAGGFNLGIPNPRIKLDDGKIVWGCECWWGDEEALKKSLEKYQKVEFIDIEEARKRLP